MLFGGFYCSENIFLMRWTLFSRLSVCLSTSVRVQSELATIINLDKLATELPSLSLSLCCLDFSCLLACLGVWVHAGSLSLSLSLRSPFGLDSPICYRTLGVIASHYDFQRLSGYL